MQQYPYGKLFNLYLDPKETHSYLIRKLAYIELLQQASPATSARSGSTRASPPPPSAGSSSSP